MGLIEKHLNAAAKFGSRGDYRSYYIGAMAIRKDGPILFSRNSFSNFPNAEAHAEFRICRKIDVGAIVFVARTSPQGWLLAKPCNSCMFQLKIHGVSKVYYTISNGEWGCIDVQSYEINKIPQGVRLAPKDPGRWNRSLTKNVA